MKGKRRGMERRGFLALAAKAAAAGWGLRGLTPGMAMAEDARGGMTYGVQLFQVRRQAATDLPGALRAIHQAGFAQVELNPVAYGHPPAELRTMVEDAGLRVVSGHFDYAGMEGKLDYARELGLRYFVCPMVPKEQWGSVGGFAKAAEVFNAVGKGAKDRGMEFVFHNHDYEFKPVDGTTGWAVLMKRTDPGLVKLELDCYWLAQAGQKPLEMLERHMDRTVLLHLKDRTANAPTSFDMETTSAHFTELGKGTIDWPAILKQGKVQGIAYAFLDQDETAGPVVESMKVSRAYLRSVRL